MEHCKLQIGCMIIVLYITFIYIREKQIYLQKTRDWLFEGLLGMGIISILFDGATAYTVNRLEQTPLLLNGILHMCFLIGLDVLVFMMFLYMLDITKGLPRKKGVQILLLLPLVINILVVILFMPELHYRQGVVTNYSMGISAYTCYVMVAIYMLVSIGIFLYKWKTLDRRKQISISTYLIVTTGVTGYQMWKPEALMTALVPTMVVISIYLNQENPLFTKLQKYHDEMIKGFATLVENRDDSTGGHIHRTTAYVELLAEELKKRGFYKDQLTSDYIQNLVMAAPMHDIGKIAIPDGILQKPGKLTAEEYTIMKTHAERGGNIIRHTFGHLGEDAYEEMAYEVARHHHEKWNGGGYPDGLTRKEIPLCARIMAIADVFDAVSAKRCYRDALPLKECFRIIEEGSETDFDPVMVEVFLDMKDKITIVYKNSDAKCGIKQTDSSEIKM